MRQAGERLIAGGPRCSFRTSIWKKTREEGVGGGEEGQVTPRIGKSLSFQSSNFLSTSKQTTITRKESRSPKANVLYGCVGCWVAHFCMAARPWRCAVSWPHFRLPRKGGTVLLSSELVPRTSPSSRSALKDVGSPQQTSASFCHE